MARQRDETIVRVGIDRDGDGTDRGHERVQRAVALRVGLRDRREEPRRAVEQLRARVLGPARLGAADRVASDETRIGARGAHDRALRRADVGDRAARRLEHLCDRRGEPRDGSRDDRQLRVADRLRERAGSLDGAALDRARERRLVGVVAAHVLHSRAPGGESDGGADQAGADDCE